MLMKKGAIYNVGRGVRVEYRWVMVNFADGEMVECVPWSSVSDD